MIQITRCYAPLEDRCCMGAPRVLMTSAASMAFNFSAAPEKAYEPAPSHRNAPRTTLQIFSRLDFFPAY